MTRRCHALAAATALLVGLVCGGPAPAASEAAPAVPWTSFRFEAERLGSRVTVEVRVDPEPAAPLPAGLWPSVRGEPLRPSGPTVLKLTVLATIDPIGIAPIRLEGRVWFDPATGTPLRTIRSREGSDDYAQWFVFGREGVFRRQHEPLDRAQAAGPPENWTRVSENAYAGPADAARCPSLAETLMLVYRMSSSAAQGIFELDPLCVFHKRQLHLVRFRAERRAQVAFDYLERRGGGGRAARGIDRRGDHPVERHADRLIPRRRGTFFQGRPAHRQRGRPPAAGGRLRVSRHRPGGPAPEGNPVRLTPGAIPPQKKTTGVRRWSRYGPNAGPVRSARSSAA